MHCDGGHKRRVVAHAARPAFAVCCCLRPLRQHGVHAACVENKKAPTLVPGLGLPADCKRAREEPAPAVGQFSF
jgi:hypothetical protein